MSSNGGRRPGAGRKPDAEAQKLRADLRKLNPKAVSALEKILDDPEHKDHAMMAKWCMDRTAAPLKAESAPVQFDLEGDTPADHARSIVAATSRGEISPSASSELLAAIGNCMKIIETSELVDRLEALENTTL